MATFVSTHFYYLGDGSDIFYVHAQNDLEATATNNDPGSTTFELNSEIDFDDGSGPSPMTYVGYYGNGWIGVDGIGHYFLATTDFLPDNTPVGVVEGAFTTCFLQGTRIATPAGEQAVEELAVGDLVIGADGRTRPVRWIGRQSVVSVFADPLRNYPVRVSAGALGDGIPVRDLCLSPDHALAIDGVLVQAGALVNGTTITRIEQPGERFTYYHVEVADHALILAEGVPAETFLDNVTRRRFDNYAEYESLHGDTPPAIPELDLPRIKSARQLPASIRSRLAARSANAVPRQDAA